MSARVSAVTSVCACPTHSPSLSNSFIKKRIAKRPVDNHNYIVILICIAGNLRLRLFPPSCLLRLKKPTTAWGEARPTRRGCGPTRGRAGGPGPLTDPPSPSPLPSPLPGLHRAVPPATSYRPGGHHPCLTGPARSRETSPVRRVVPGGRGRPAPGWGGGRGLARLGPSRPSLGQGFQVRLKNGALTLHFLAFSMIFVKKSLQVFKANGFTSWDLILNAVLLSQGWKVLTW